MWHHLIIGLLLGWGAAVPIGPVNLEVIRRNLCFGSSYGLVFSLGAGIADLIYLVLIFSGMLIFLQHPFVLNIVGLIGSFILIYFGVSALKLRVSEQEETQLPNTRDPVLWHYFFQGLLMTILNPFTILFWASVSSQILLLPKDGAWAVIFVGLGTLLGTSSWAVALNTALHFMRHRISKKVMQYLNYLGGGIILCLAAAGLWRALSGLIR